jgi:hypothetical protein
MKPETIYRRFFIAAILVILSVGALWGAFLLWQIGKAGSFTRVSIHAINAHGHAQIFGWVGLFIMGFAYQAFPRMWGTRLIAPHLAVTTFVLMTLGVALSTLGIFYAEAWSLASSIVMIGGILQIVAVFTFAGQMLTTFTRSHEPVSPAIGFIFCALLFFCAMTVMNLWHTLALMHAESRDALLAQIATYQAALRDLQIHGLAMFMILGVSMRAFPGMFGFSRTPAGQGWAALLILVLAVIGEVVLLIASQRTGNQSLMMLLIAPWMMLVLGVGIIVLPWRLWRPLPVAHRSTKFVRTAYLWLGLSLLMLLAMPAYMAMREMSFSHAYHGAMRHAITVGFVSMMIMGVSAKVVPNLNGVDHRGLSALWGPFILINLGCLLRVSMQILTDWQASFFSMIAISGVLEVTGLAWWGISLIHIMLRPRRFAEVPAEEQRSRTIAPTGCTCCGVKESRATESRAVKEMPS